MSIPHTFMDFDQLRYTYPRLPDDPWGIDLAFLNLEAVWRNCSARGSRNLIVSSVVEDQAFIDQLLNAIPGSEVTTFQLFARPDTLKARVEKREMGSGLEWHKNRAVELLGILSGNTVPCNFSINTDDRAIMDIAVEVVEQIDWQRQRHPFGENTCW